MTSLDFYLMVHDVFWIRVSMQSVVISVHYKLIRKCLKSYLKFKRNKKTLFWTVWEISSSHRCLVEDIQSVKFKVGPM